MSDQLPPPLVPPGEEGRTGPAWGRPGPTGTRFLETVRAVLLDPNECFSTMRRRGGLGAPLVFGIAGTLAGSLIGALYQLMFASLGSFDNPAFAGDAAVAGLLSGGCIVVMIPFIAVLSMFVGAAIYHVMLMLLGAARQPFETTMRVVAYTMGSTSILQIVPFFGGLLAAVWAIVAHIIGLARAHEISTGTSAAAVLIPIVLCCVIVAFFFAAMLAMFMGAAFTGFQG
jgi:hypothetical protein